MDLHVLKGSGGTGDSERLAGYEKKISPESIPNNVWDAYELDPASSEVWKHGNGLINLTYRISGDHECLLLQRINTHVFKDPQGLMRNVEAVLDHLEGVLRLHPIGGGANFIEAQDGFWRAYNYIGNSYVRQRLDSPAQAREVAQAFARFHCDLSDFDSSRLVDTIPKFHHTPWRYECFELALEKAVDNRPLRACEAIELARAHRELQHRLVDADLPQRVVHNDTKVNNILFCADTDDAICIIDLDTVMPGTVLNDYGDLIRVSAAATVEDSPNLDKVDVRMDLAQALRQGYLDGAGGFLTPIELDLLDQAPIVLTYELALRFLTDYLDHDHYFKTDYPEHNLVRSMNQFTLMQRMLERWG